MAVRLGYDAPLLATIAGRLARAVMQDMRRSVKQQHGLASVASLHAGVVTVVQRFRSDLGLYVHLAGRRRAALPGRAAADAGAHDRRARAGPRGGHHRLREHVIPRPAEPRSGDKRLVLADDRWDRWKTRRVGGRSRRHSADDLAKPRERRVGVRWVVAVVAMKCAAVPAR